MKHQHCGKKAKVGKKKVLVLLEVKLLSFELLKSEMMAKPSRALA